MNSRISDKLCDLVLDWVNSPGIDIYDLFGESAKAKISSEYNIGELFDEFEIAEHVNETYSPEDIFEEEQLTKWAKEHGFTKEKK
jgi:hypothetical protein